VGTLGVKHVPARSEQPICVREATKEARYDPSMTTPIRSLGVLRAAVGVALLAAPKAIGRNEDPASALLMRTIGVRDLVLGIGATTAQGPAAIHWGRAVLASDSIDIVVGAAAISKVGVSGGLVATLLPVPFALADIWALRSS
jgi:hypothetical protein